MAPLAPGATIGILGGGQLGRMLALAAAELGFRCHIYVADGDAPACDVAAFTTRADYTDSAALARFAASASVVTTEFENVPAETAAVIARHIPVRPGALALAVCQDRLAEKDFAHRTGLATARHAPVDTEADLTTALATVGVPAILKTRRLGYDGKGQARIDRATDAPAAFAALGSVSCVLEARIAFSREISAIVARGSDGAVVAYEPAWNIHRNGILARSIVPAGVPEPLAKAALEGARRLADALDYVGVLSVEYFVAPGTDGAPSLLVNELAPRVHNSGHWTLDGAATSQFAQHIRAIAGWPLAPTTRHADIVMDNLIGADVSRWESLKGEPQARLHLYGKNEIRPGRKMGHVNWVYPLAGRPADEVLAAGSLA